MAGSSHEPQPLLHVPPMIGLESDCCKALPSVCRPWKQSSIVRRKRRGDLSEAQQLAARLEAGHRTAQPLWNVGVDVDQVLQSRGVLGWHVLAHKMI